MPPRIAPAKPKTPAVQAAPAEDALVQQLESMEAALATAAERLDRLASVQVALDGERGELNSRLREERTQFGDISCYLKRELEEQTRRANGLEAQLAEVQAQLAAALAAADERALAVEQQRVANEGTWQAQLEEQRERLRQADDFLMERDALRVRADQMTVQMEEQTQQYHKRQLDMERKHAGDRELWRRDTQAAVQAAREEMAALTDQRLDVTTQKTILDNEAMAAELQYQGRYVLGLLSRNAALQAEVQELRLALNTSYNSEEELARKALACGKVADSLLARLADVEAQCVERDATLSAAQEQVQEAREEARSLALRLEDQRGQVEQLEASLVTKQKEIKLLKASHSDAANFLLMCMADVRQEVLAAQGHVALPAAGGGSKGGQPQPQQQQRSSSSKDDMASSADAAPAGPEASGASGQPAVLLAELSMQQRQVVLAKLLHMVCTGWQDSEGLVLPASGSPSTCFVSLLSDTKAVLSARPAGLAVQASNCSPKAQGSSRWQAAGSGLQAASNGSSCTGCMISANSVPEDGNSVPEDGNSVPEDGKPFSSELMQQLQSDVRPWGRGSGGSGKTAKTRDARG